MLWTTERYISRGFKLESDREYTSATIGPFSGSTFPSGLFRRVNVTPFGPSSVVLLPVPTT